VNAATGSIETIRALVLDSSGQPLTGLTNIKIKIRRESDGLDYDWSDNTFKAGPSQRLQALKKVSDVYWPGEYILDSVDHPKGWDTSKISNPSPDDVYSVTAVQDGAGSAANLPQVGEIKIGRWVDTIDKLTTYHLEMSFSYAPRGDVLVGNIWLESENGVVVVSGSVQVDVYDADRVLQFSMTDAAPDAGGVFKVTQGSPGFANNASYYAEAAVTLPGGPMIRGVKGIPTIGPA
jgi:hypothetical protein